MKTLSKHPLLGIKTSRSAAWLLPISGWSKIRRIVSATERKHKNKAIIYLFHKMHATLKCFWLVYTKRTIFGGLHDMTWCCVYSNKLAIGQHKLYICAVHFDKVIFIKANYDSQPCTRGQVFNTKHSENFKKKLDDIPFCKNLSVQLADSAS